MVDPSRYPYRIGRVARPHGLRGDVLVQLFRRRERGGPALRLRRLETPLSVEVEHEDERTEELRISHIRWLDPLRATFRFIGVSDRGAAERLVGVYVDVDPTHPCEELFDAVDGCFEARAVDADTGALIGLVEAITDNGAQPLLEVALEGQSEDDPALVPVVPEIVVGMGVDDDGRFVRIRPLPGLFEVNR